MKNFKKEFDNTIATKMINIFARWEKQNLKITYGR